MKVINRIKLKNFKRFSLFDVSLNEKLNIFIGENETGKSSILSAINLVLSGSQSQVQRIGIERLLNSQAVETFLDSEEKRYEDMPVLYVELWLNEQNNYELNGKNNSEGVTCDGLRLECRPDDNLSNEINQILSEDETNFPFEYYTVNFNTFQGDPYTGYKKFLKHIVIDTSLIGSDYALREYVSDMYDTYVEGIAEQNKHQNEYRKAKDVFRNEALSELNSRVEGYSFSLKHDVKTNLRTDLTLVQNNIGIDNKGKGEQCFIKTEFALKKAENARRKIDIVLIEEPENHLSHINMKRLIQRISQSDDKQLFIATHSNLISSRLDLRNTILLHTNSFDPVLLDSLPEDTAKYFIKAPDHGILDFVLSQKVILVEGDAEYMLMEAFYKHETGNNLESDNIHIISVDGTSFKRYLDIAKLLDMKVVVIRDNDGDFQSNCVDLYTEYVSDLIKVFGDPDDENRRTFEVCIYRDNQGICDSLFTKGRRTLSILDYMLKNKTEAAFILLKNMEENFVVPQYIRDAIEWIRS